jgi:hypothetical protein
MITISNQEVLLKPPASLPVQSIRSRVSASSSWPFILSI